MINIPNILGQSGGEYTISKLVPNSNFLNIKFCQIKYKYQPLNSNIPYTSAGY